METNEMMTFEEVMEPTMEIAEAASRKGLKVVAGIGLAVLAGGIAYKYAVKPIVAKIRAKKEEKLFEDLPDGIDFDDITAEVVDDSEEK